jgi:hypothetical protein
MTKRRQAPAPRRHSFVIFRIGDDICGKCGKPRADHSALLSPRPLKRAHARERQEQREMDHESMD